VKRISIIIILALALGGGALAVAQEPDQATDQAVTVPPPEKAMEAVPLSPLAAEVDKALKATIARAGRSAVAAEAKPVAEAKASDCLLADEHENIQVLLTEQCVTAVKSQLAQVESKQLPDADAQPEPEDQPAADGQRP
jgi:hypothetical protein